MYVVTWVCHIMRYWTMQLIVCIVVDLLVILCAMQNTRPTLSYVGIFFSLEMLEVVTGLHCIYLTIKILPIGVKGDELP